MERPGSWGRGEGKIEEGEESRGGEKWSWGRGVGGRGKLRKEKEKYRPELMLGRGKWRKGKEKKEAGGG